MLIDLASSPRRNLFLILILGALTTISPFAIDMYLPAFQKMAEQFRSTPAQMSLSLSSYFIGLAIGQVFYGPFLDRFGRKKPMYFGMSLFVVASFACMWSFSVESLVIARFFQALGGCSASVAAVAMVRDFFPPDDGAKVFSRLMLVLSVSPLFAPTVGGWIVSLWGWQAIFLVLALIVAFFLALVFFVLPEGHQPDPSVSLRPGPILKTFGEIFRHPQFFTYAVSGAFSFAGLFTYLAGAPSIFLETFGLSEKVFGLIFAFLSIGMIGGGQVNILLTRKFSGARIYKTAFTFQVLIGLLFAIGCWFDWYGLTAHVGIFFVYISCVGLTYPNAAALALRPFDRNAGSASALLGTVQMGVGALAATVFGLIKLAPNMAVAIVFVLSSMTGFLILNSVKKN